MSNLPNRKKVRQTAAVGEECVACGCCVRECPVRALSVPRGVRAVVDEARCVGCGRCVKACPAGVLALTPRKEGTARAETA